MKPRPKTGNMANVPGSALVQKFWMALKIPESRPQTGKTKNFIVQNKFRDVSI